MSETAFLAFRSVFLAASQLVYAACFTAFLVPFLAARAHRRGKAALVFLAYLGGFALCEKLGMPQGLFGILLAVLLVLASGPPDQPRPLARLGPPARHRPPARPRLPAGLRLPAWLRLSAWLRPPARLGPLGLKRATAFLLAVLYWNTRTSAGLMAESLYYIAERLYPSDPAWLETVYLRAAVLITLFLVSHTVLMAAMLYILQRRMRKRPMPLSLREVCYLCIVPAAGILTGQILSRLLIEIQDGVLLQLYERHPVFLAAVPLLALLFYAGAYFAIAVWQGMAALREEQGALFVERQQAQLLSARIHEAERSYARIRALQHEMRGHFTNLKGLAQSGALAGITEYIDKMNMGIREVGICDTGIGGIGDVGQTIQTGNPVADVIVNDKRRQCGELGIRFEAELCYPSPEAYDAFDVGIILQNLLQNALEACESVPEGGRYIRLTGKRTGRFFLIEVRNPFAGEVAFGPDGLPRTTKQENAPMHGLGLTNVRREAEKYMGELELKAGPREFIATVLLQERCAGSQDR